MNAIDAVAAIGLSISFLHQAALYRASARRGGRDIHLSSSTTSPADGSNIHQPQSTESQANIASANSTMIAVFAVPAWVRPSWVERW
jgi:hypothetical protein